ncbi:MAG TPA: gliding motility-associated protein GldE [Flavobacteriales bacterium]|nr:gliding motility-associated protein GldE [Flavobacteriales bacterium]
MDTHPLPLLFAVKEFDSVIIPQIVVILILLVLSGLIAAAEIAFFSLSPGELKILEDSDTSTSKRILAIVGDTKKIIATVLVGANLVNIAIIILFAELIDTVFSFGPGQEYIKFLIDAVAVTFLLLLVCEVVPKVYANQNAYRVANIMAVPFQFLEGLLRPLTWLLLSTSSYIDKRFRRRNHNVTVDDLGHALELTIKKDETSEEEKRILEGIVRFGNTEASQIMKSRMDVVAVDSNTTFDQLIPVILMSGYSRIPVYTDSLDKIVGVLVAKDILPYLDEPASFDWKKLMREPYYVPGHKKIDDLLMDFRHERTHMAIAVDEYGGTLGIVTLEDVLEEIVGDITDEFDDEDITYTKIDEKNYVFEGKTHLMDIYKVLKIDGDEFEKSRGEADTLAGFLLEISGRFLSKNEKIKFEQYTFTVEAADKKRIKQIKITINDAADKDGSTGGMKTLLLVIPLLMMMFTSCGDNTTTPRPRGYMRIELPPRELDSVPSSQPFLMLKNKIARFDLKQINNNVKGNYSEIVYPKLKATLYLTYMQVDTNLAKLIDDCHQLAYNHSGKADDIVSVKIEHPEHSVYGLIYEFKGNAATPLQFYVTDSTANFLRGSLYFYARPNLDSIKPVLEYVRKDLDEGLKSLVWKNKGK